MNDNKNKNEYDPKDWKWEEIHEYRDKTHWKLTHKKTKEVREHWTYGDGWGYTDEEMMGMDTHEFAVYLAFPW